MTLGLELSYLARGDIEDIYLYTHQHYGERQAESYVEALYAAFRTLTETPNLGYGRTDLPMGCKVYTIKKHTIIYRYDTRAVYVARVLHNRMDITRHTI